MICARLKNEFVKMYKIGIIGSETCFKTTEVKDFLFKIKKAFGATATIYSGGNKSGIEHDVKKTCLLFELPYKEFNPAFTGHNLYSALPEDYYSKGWHCTHYIHRYEQMLFHIDRLVIGQQPDSKDSKIYLSIYRKAQKRGIKTVLI